ncbi:Ubiquitin--protein ligase [Handroanthus impetiginosus]|uniref:Ubiquitin--protein ligase n=1 Tax=Handroanthus impetiginosus TaxID=429701 RepID=A0A2G9FYJ4_9LAMI|nr:Ubiquitin--protein ligase [Handroanthus impetiginosus]
MKTNQPKLNTTPRSSLFSCGFFRQCTQTVLSPTTYTPPPLPQEPPPPPPPPPVQPLPPSQPESSSSSSNASQSFTQWRFSLSNSPISHHHSCSQPQPETISEPDPKTDAGAPPLGINASLEEVFHVAELQFSSGSHLGRVGAVHLLERSVVPNPRSMDGCPCPMAVVGGVVTCLREGVARKPASKVLLALCLVEGNRRVAVKAQAVTAVVEALTDAESVVVERSLAALELLCTTAEGAGEVRAHALAVPMMVQVMGRMEGRGKEHAISVLAVIYSGLDDESAVAPPEEVARAVTLALRGDCSARGRRKGEQLLKILQENGRLEMTEEER